MVPDAWQSTWVGDSTEWAHARARASRAGKFARRGKKGLGALAARNLGSRRLRRWETRREALCGQAGGPLPREVTRGRSMPGQRVGARHTKEEQVGRDRSRVGVQCKEYGRAGLDPAKSRAGRGQGANEGVRGNGGDLRAHHGCLFEHAKTFFPTYPMKRGASATC